MSGTANFYEKDFASGLFPMQTSLCMVSNIEKELTNYIYQKILDEGQKDHCFLPQQRVFADKPRKHLRRTVKLDPVAEFFLYDVVYRNREIFRKPFSENRYSFGYRFESGDIVPISTSYRDFVKQVGEAHKKYRHSLSFDISAYFNSIYHHDLSHWFNSFDKVDEKDKRGFSQFMREINSGRSIDFLPHGLYPSKMIGSEFLKFIELNGRLKSAKLLRFMDDFYLFDDKFETIEKDFQLIQVLMGQKALNINPLKTKKGFSDVADKVSSIRDALSEIVSVELNEGYSPSGWDGPEDDEFEIQYDLTKAQMSEIFALLRDESLDEHDAELILGLLKNYPNESIEHISTFLSRFPSLSKVICNFLADLTDKKSIADALEVYLDESSDISEFQMFWLANLIEWQLMGTKKAEKLLLRLYAMSSDSVITRAKLLEIPTPKYGFKELRDDFLKNGSSNWLSWASAMGTRKQKSAERNYALDYFSKCSHMNFLVAESVKRQP